MYDPVKGSDEEEGIGKYRDEEMATRILKSPAPIKGRENRLGKERLASLDVFRGITVALMIFVDDVGGLLPAISHSPWDGINLADYVMPFFLFIVGLSLAFAYKNLHCRVTATKKATARTLKLLLIGILLQGGFFHGLNNLTYGIDIEKIRWTGILQRIAIAYLFAGLCEIWLKGDDQVRTGLGLVQKYRFHWAVALLCTIMYISLSYGLYVPDWEYQIPFQASEEASKTYFVKCGVRGDTGPACNAVGMIDRKMLGIQHLYRKPIYARSKQCSIYSPSNGPLPPDAPSWCQAPFEPEGILSSLMAVVTCLIGLHYGHVVVHFKDTRKRIVQWLIPSSILFVHGHVLDLCGMHINKPLYTFSYMCVTASAAGVLFTGIYVVVDVLGFRRASLVFEWLGIHALAIFIVVACNILVVFLQGFYWKEPGNNIFRLVGIGA